MAKPKHPTINSLKQGQTVYCVVFGSLLTGNNTPDYVVKYHLFSDKTPTPDPGTVIEKITARVLRKAIKFHGAQLMDRFFYSRRIAEREAGR